MAACVKASENFSILSNRMIRTCINGGGEGGCPTCCKNPVGDSHQSDAADGPLHTQELADARHASAAENNEPGQQRLECWVLME